MQGSDGKASTASTAPLQCLVVSRQSGAKTLARALESPAWSQALHSKLASDQVG